MWSKAGQLQQTKSGEGLPKGETKKWWKQRNLDVDLGTNPSKNGNELTDASYLSNCIINSGMYIAREKSDYIFTQS